MKKTKEFLRSPAAAVIALVLAAALLMLQHGGDAAGEGVQTADHRRVRVGLQGTPGGHAALLRPQKSPLWVSRPGSP